MPENLRGFLLTLYTIVAAHSVIKLRYDEKLSQLIKSAENKKELLWSASDDARARHSAMTLTTRCPLSRKLQILLSDRRCIVEQ